MLLLTARFVFWHHVLTSKLMPQEIKDKMINLCIKMAIKVTKGQISNGTISQNTCLEKYYLCEKFDRFMKKYTIFWLCHNTNMAISLHSLHADRKVMDHFAVSNHYWDFHTRIYITSYSSSLQYCMCTKDNNKMLVYTCSHRYWDSKIVPKDC